MSQIESDTYVESSETNASTADKKVRNYNDELDLLFESYLKATSEPRLLSQAEERILAIITNCFKIWYEPWKKTFLSDGREFNVVYDLMEGLLHYEYQITNSNAILSNNKTNAIEQAVIRLVDYGNAILNIDLIIRISDDSSNELDPFNITTIELYHAHLRANNLRKKLLYDYYFKRDKYNSITSIGIDVETLTNSVNNGIQVSSLSNLQVPNSSMLPSPSSDKSPTKTPVGSSLSINTIALDGGRRTPQSFHSPSQSQIEIRLSNPDASINASDLSQIETTHMTATIKSLTFSAPQNHATRLTLLPGILAKIESLLSVPSNAEKTINCFELLDALLNSIEKLPVELRSKEVNMILKSLLKPIVRKVYIDDRDSFVEYQNAHWTTCLFSMMRMTTASDFSNYLRQFSRADLGAFLKDYLFIVKRIMSTAEPTANNSILQMESESMIRQASTYPEYWIEMKLLACSVFFNSLTYLYQILKQCFSSNLQTWMSFIDSLIHFIMQDTLKPGRVMLKERQKLLANDLRQTAAEYIWISWDSLSLDQKQQLLEDLIEPLLRACMILDSRQRSILLPIFYDMMRCDYSSQYMTSLESNDNSGASTIQSARGEYRTALSYQDNGGYVQNRTRTLPKFHDSGSLPYLSCGNESVDGTVLTKFTHLIIGKLNTLMIDLNLGDEHFKKEICAAISGKLNPKFFNCNSMLIPSDSGQFKSMAQHTSDLIAEFMQICLDSRQANKSYYKHIYLLCLFKLILFFKDKVDIVELYLNNLYKLCYLHHTTGKYIEAGFTLLEHAKTLQWSDKPLEGNHRIINKFFNAPEPLTDYSSLKIFLYNTIIEYFDKGQIWEAAIPLCRELVEFYEFKTYEYEKVAIIMQKMSGFFGKIVDIGSRSNPEYFRVTFYGSGFPSSIRETTMIYRGKPYEKLGDFQATMLEKYPDTKLLHTLARPDDEIIDEPNARFLQINACSPVVDLKTRFGENLPKVEDAILNYYRHNECDRFNFSRRIMRPKRDNVRQLAPINGDNFANMWRERTTLTTNTLPGMLPFFPVYLAEISIVSPIESAIEDLERANDRLSCMLNRFKADKRQVEDVRLLGQLLLGIVDAAVNGGITKYEEAFFGAQPPPPSIATSTQSVDTNQYHQQQVQVSPPTMMETSNSNHNTVTTNEATVLQQQSTCVDNINHVIASLRLDGGRGVDPGCDKYGYHANVGSDERPTNAQVDRLKHLIAQQVPLLDEAIRLHRDRVADVMRPQHEHLEASYKKLKHHIMNNYYRYLPADYKSRSHSTMRSYRSLARSPNRSMRSESRLPFTSNSARYSSKRMSDAGPSSEVITKASATCILTAQNNIENYSSATASNIPYKQLECDSTNERRSLPFLTGVPLVDRDLIKSSAQKSTPSSLELLARTSKAPNNPLTQVFAPYDGLKPPVAAIRTNPPKNDSQLNGTYTTLPSDHRSTTTKASSKHQLYARLIGDEKSADEDKSEEEQEENEQRSLTSPDGSARARQDGEMKLVVL